MSSWHDEVLECPEKTDNAYINNTAKLLQRLGKSELDYHTITNNMPLLIFSTLILTLGLLSNLVVIVLVWKHKHLRSPMNMLLLNMSFGHFISCIALFVFCYVIDTGQMSMVAATAKSLDLLCGLVTDGNGIYFISAGSYLLTLCAISFNRYSAIRFPAQQNLRMGKRAVLVYNATSWLVAAGWVVPSLISFKYDAVTKLCLRNWKVPNPFVYRLVALMWSIILPLIFLILSFSVIMCKRTENNILNEDARRAVRLQRAEKLLGLLIVTFLFTWAPFFVYWAVYTMTDMFYGCIGEYRAMSWMRIAIIFSSLNTAIDPFLYTVGSREIRKIVIRTIRKLKPSSNRVGSSVLNDAPCVKGKHNTGTTPVVAIQLNGINQPLSLQNIP